MKKVSLIALSILTFSTMLHAQSNKEEVDLYQSLFGMEKKAIVSQFVKPEGATGEAFWTLYDQYETERKALGLNRLELLNEYAENYNDMSGEKMDELVGKMMKQIGSTNKLVNKYYKKVRSACGSKTAAQFYQIENYFVSSIRLMILENIPFIGELEN